MSKNTIKIANCSGFYGDRLSAAKEMVDGGPIDVLTGDYLAELTMAILYGQKIQRGEKAGYVGTFLKQLKQIASSCSEKNIKVVSNAGGLNPKSMAEEVKNILDSEGLNLKVAYIDGDDFMDTFDELKKNGEELKNLDTGASLFKQNLPRVSANYYLGCWGIKKALDEGADIVICPRVTDAALVMGPAAWKFNWSRDDYDKLAGSLAAGHIIECGAQATGGNYSFFKEVPSFQNVGFPIAEIEESGNFKIYKHKGTGGLVSTGTVTAQLLYEISSPKYLSPDVIAHFDSLKIEDLGDDKVFISNVKGSPPTNKHKACINLAGGYKNSMELIVTGLDIEEKAKIFTDELFRTLGGRDEFDDVSIQLIRTDKEEPLTNEEAMAILKIDVKSSSPEKVGRIFSAKVIELALANYPGWTAQSEIKQASPFISYWPALVDSKNVKEKLHVNNKSQVIEIIKHQEQPINLEKINIDEYVSKDIEKINFGRIFGTRSGDKGGCANLGVWAKDTLSFSYLYHFLTVEQLKKLLPDLECFEIERYELPNIFALNFYVKGILENGVSSNNRKDGQAKSLGEYLGTKLIDCPREFIEKYAN
ncbi:MAG: acyclic terpene utilization AtuA family protein [Gammaproteobacteria bacterium]